MIIRRLDATIQRVPNPLLNEKHAWAIENKRVSSIATTIHQLEGQPICAVTKTELLLIEADAGCSIRKKIMTSAEDIVPGKYASLVDSELDESEEAAINGFYRDSGYEAK